MGHADAKLVYPIRAKGNELLVSLLVGNVIVNAALTVVVDKILPGDTVISAIFTILFSTILITFFGEILPQAIFKKKGLEFGAMLSPYLRTYLKLVSPVARPIAHIIDKTVGPELPSFYSTDELVKILEEHEKSDQSDIEADEIAIVRNAINFGDKLVHEVMTPKSVVASVSKGEILSPEVLQELHKSGHSRFPVIDPETDEVIGTLFIRDLIDVNKHSKTVEQAMDKRVYFVNEGQYLDHALNGFIRTKYHMFIVINEFKEMTGIITIEDIIEEIMGREIVDEFDRYDDMREVASLHAKKHKNKNRIVGPGRPKLD
jgi:metal transporter CNNM